MNAPLWPTERLPPAAASLNLLGISAAVTPGTFRKVLKAAARLHLAGPVTNLYPHLLRHACATHNYEAGMTLWEVQKLLGHDRTTTTVRYVATVQANPERAARASADRAAQRLIVDKGICDEVEPALGGGPARHLAAERSADGVSAGRFPPVVQ